MIGADATGASAAPLIGHRPGPLRSFWIEGFEGADHRNRHGRPLAMSATSGHNEQMEAGCDRLVRYRRARRAAKRWPDTSRPPRGRCARFVLTDPPICVRAAQPPVAAAAARIDEFERQAFDLLAGCAESRLPFPPSLPQPRPTFTKAASCPR